MFLYIAALAKTARTIFVKRNDPESRTKTKEEICRRAASQGKWPVMAIFPEGKQLFI